MTMTVEEKRIYDRLLGSEFLETTEQKRIYDRLLRADFLENRESQHIGVDFLRYVLYHYSDTEKIPFILGPTINPIEIKYMRMYKDAMYLLQEIGEKI